MTNSQLKNRFGISNLIFNSISSNTIESILDYSDICDFAPTIHYGDWDKVPNKIPLNPYKNKNTEICALQSLFYGIQDISLLKGEQEFINLQSQPYVWNVLDVIM